MSSTFFSAKKTWMNCKGPNLAVIIIHFSFSDTSIVYYTNFVNLKLQTKTFFVKSLISNAMDFQRQNNIEITWRNTTTTMGSWWTTVTSWISLSVVWSLLERSEDNETWCTLYQEYWVTEHIYIYLLFVSGYNHQ